MCDCFCYSGGFSVYGLKNGARFSTLVEGSNERDRPCKGELQP